MEYYYDDYSKFLWIMVNIEGEVIHITRQNAKKQIVERGITNYGKTGYTRLIHKLFSEIRNEIKDSNLIAIVDAEEKRLKKYLYDPKSKITDEEMKRIWKEYENKYSEKLYKHSKL